VALCAHQRDDLSNDVVRRPRRLLGIVDREIGEAIGLIALTFTCGNRAIRAPNCRNFSM
jgi:hypothetical protein